MKLLKLNESGASVNADHIVSLERKPEAGQTVLSLLSGSAVLVADVYPVAYDLFRVGTNVWVNPAYVSIVDVGYNKDEAFRDIMASKGEKNHQDYMQVRIETVLGEGKYVWADFYGVDELDYLAELLEVQN